MSEDAETYYERQREYAEAEYRREEQEAMSTTGTLFLIICNVKCTSENLDEQLDAECSALQQRVAELEKERDFLEHHTLPPIEKEAAYESRIAELKAKCAELMGERDRYVDLWQKNELKLNVAEAFKAKVLESPRMNVRVVSGMDEVVVGEPKVGTITLQECFAVPCSEVEPEVQVQGELTPERFDVLNVGRLCLKLTTGEGGGGGGGMEVKKKVPHVRAWGIERPKYLSKSEWLRPWAADSKGEAKDYCGPEAKPIRVVVIRETDFKKLLGDK